MMLISLQRYHLEQYLGKQVELTILGGGIHYMLLCREFVELLIIFIYDSMISTIKIQLNRFTTLLYS